VDWDLLGRIVTGVLSVTTIIATALVGVLFGSLKTLRDTANDLRSRVTDLEKERVEDRAEIAESQSENRLLKAMVTGKVEWVALTDQLEEHHRQAVSWWGETRTILSEIRNALGGRK
jgi:chromosome segregation ATPase